MREGHTSKTKAKPAALAVTVAVCASMLIGTIPASAISLSGAQSVPAYADVSDSLDADVRTDGEASPNPSVDPSVNPSVDADIPSTSPPDESPRSSSDRSMVTNHIALASDKRLVGSPKASDAAKQEEPEGQRGERSLLLSTDTESASGNEEDVASSEAEPSVQAQETSSASDPGEALIDTGHTLYLRHTYADASHLSDNETIDSMFADPNALADKLITTFESSVPLYEVSPNADYWVAFVAPSYFNGGGEDPIDWLVAETNADAVMIEDVIVDPKEGIAYVPKAHYFDDRGKERGYGIQIQLLVPYDISRGKNASIRVTIENRGDDATALSRSLTADIDGFDVTATIPVATPETAGAIGLEDLTVYVDGSQRPFPLSEETALWDAFSGELTILKNPLSISSVHVIIGNDDESPALAKAYAASSASLTQLGAVPGQTLEYIGDHELEVGDRFLYSSRQTNYAMREDLADDSDFVRAFNRLLPYLYCWNTDNASEDAYHVITSTGRTSWNDLPEPVNAAQKLTSAEQNYLGFYLALPTSPSEEYPNAYSYLTNQDGETFSFTKLGYHTGSDWWKNMVVLQCTHISTPAEDLGENNPEQLDVPAIMRVLTLGDGYAVVGFATARTTTQSGVGVYKFALPPSKGDLELRKKSSDGKITDGNSTYTLQGAIYGVYSDKACAGNPVATLTTDAKGYAKSDKLPSGTYFVKEISSPRGYELDDAVYQVKVSPGDTATINANEGGTVPESPLFDTPDILVRKVDAQTADGSPQGHASLAGAEFTVRYYDGTYETESDAEKSGAAKRSWLFATDEDGHVILDEAHLISGDDLYLDSEGNAALPLGTIIIKETKEPEGYLINGETFIVHITEEGLNGKTPIGYVTPIVEDHPVRGGLSIAKELAGGSPAELEGIRFDIVNRSTHAVIVGGGSYEPGSCVMTLELDATGRAQTARDALPCGMYDIIEVRDSVPDSIMAHEDAKGGGSPLVETISIEGGSANHERMYELGVTNYKKPSFILAKVDGDSLAMDSSGGGDAVPVEDSEWLLEFMQGETWMEVERGTTDEDGMLLFSDQAISKWGTYRLTETHAANEEDPRGYLTRADSNMPDSVTFTIDEATWENIEAGTYTGLAGDSWSFEMRDGIPTLVREERNWLKRSLEAIKIDEDTQQPVADTVFALYRWKGDGEPKEIGSLAREGSHERYSQNPELAGAPESTTDLARPVDPDLWELVEEKKTNESGSALFEGLSFGYYQIVETLPNMTYAEWWESDLSTWGRYWFTCDDKSGRHQVQVFANDLIELETTVSKSSIEITSAAFASLEDQQISFDNVGSEEFRYDVSFSNGDTNVRADQYTVVDTCDFTDFGVRLRRLWTPIVENDSDARLNVWYRTNLTDDQASYSTASATIRNPENLLSDGSDRIETTGWKLWEADLSAEARCPLSTADLELGSDEYVTGLMLEYGSVETGFQTIEPLTYLVACTERLIPVAALSPLIPNAVTSHVTRNWNGGAQGEGLSADASDDVLTAVIASFSLPSTQSKYRGSLAKTGDAGIPPWLLALSGGSALAAATLALSMRPHWIASSTPARRARSKDERL